ncbi:GNAT family N-acetyltransferase [Alkalihalobacillus sp. CinArs1]|uniref:GNAT family N-acetyltransferase n=1 Tax=Alkalihalobacillus sp. CinArs1 TaxID=2995314 RepID=UPI0022DD67A1|nr:GNAT family N-acetyltransferase [Alkalihalobacillus sp. CinArs1]
MAYKTRLVDNFVNKVSYFAKRLKTMEVIETRHATIVDSGYPSDTFNVIAIRQTLSEEVFLGAISRFKKKEYPLSVWCWNEESTRGNDLINLGLVQVETNVAMVMEMNDVVKKPVLPKGFEIKKIESPEDIVLFGALISSFFGDSLEGKAVKSYYDDVASLSMKSSDLTLYIGIAGGKPVTTGSMIVSSDSVGIYDMGTSDEERGKGYGTAMFRYLLSEASKYEKDACFLQASPDGYAIYKSAGFKAIGEMKVYGWGCDS